MSWEICTKRCRLSVSLSYVEGLDLSRLVKSKGPMPVVHACYFAHQAALGLQHAHERGMVHRDIKPYNLMLTHDGNRRIVKVLDFGLAKVTREEKVDGGLTAEGQALGTPDFIAPEQILDAPSADIRADIYSLGCILYYLLSGHPPFKANSLYDMFQVHISRDADPLNLKRPEVPSKLAALVAKMMAKDPTRRFQTPGEVAKALEPFFKKGGAAFKDLEAELSQDGQKTVGEVVTGAVSVPTQPATDFVGAAARPKKGIETSPPPSRWESLVDLPETEGSQEQAHLVPLNRKPPWVWPSIAAGILLLGFVVAWGVTLRVKTANGTIELVNLPKDADVVVDGKRLPSNGRAAASPRSSLSRPASARSR